MPSNLKPKADEAENEAGNRGGEAEEERKGTRGNEGERKKEAKGKA